MNGSNNIGIADSRAQEEAEQLEGSDKLSTVAMAVLRELASLSSSARPKFFIHEASIGQIVNEDPEKVRKAVAELESHGLLEWSGDWIQAEHKIYTLSNRSSTKTVPDDELLALGKVTEQSKQRKSSTEASPNDKSGQILEGESDLFPKHRSKPSTLLTKKKVSVGDLLKLKVPPESVIALDGEECFPLFIQLIPKYWRCKNFYIANRHRDFLMLAISDLVEITTRDIAIWIVAEYGWRSVDVVLQEYRARRRLNEKLGTPVNFLLNSLVKTHPPLTAPPPEVHQLMGSS